MGGGVENHSDGEDWWQRGKCYESVTKPVCHILSENPARFLLGTLVLYEHEIVHLSRSFSFGYKSMMRNNNLLVTLPRGPGSFVRIARTWRIDSLQNRVELVGKKVLCPPYSELFLFCEKSECDRDGSALLPRVEGN
jgi:hypothetical protein